MQKIANRKTYKRGDSDHQRAKKLVTESECNTCPWAKGCVSFFRPQDKCREFARRVMEA